MRGWSLASSAVRLARIDQVLDVGVVVGDLGQVLAAQHVRPRVADVHEADLRPTKRSAVSVVPMPSSSLSDAIDSAMRWLASSTERAQRREQVGDRTVLVQAFQRAR